jgi:hypothetical protein
MMMDSLARLNTHADPGMGRVSANVARRWIREPPYEGVGSGRNYQADWAHVGPGARGSGDELRPRRVWVLRKERSEAIDLQPVTDFGAEIVLTVNGHWGDAEPTGPLTRAQFVRE